MELCRLMIEQKIEMKWTCNSRVDYVDEEMLQQMYKAGCWYISWGMESGNEEILKHAHKGITPERVRQALGLGSQGWHQELGLLHHRLARRDRRNHSADDCLCQIVTAGYCPFPHRGALSRNPILL